ncbi:MAG: hypothetical protein HY903_04275 [Deltaproteobacteria bacterium]|nr:hypothetical protein [Deltaproteobacteria bacterium]
MRGSWLMVVPAVVVAGGCTYNFPSEDSPNTFACKTDSDCVGGYVCRNGFCAGSQAAGGDPNGNIGGDSNTGNTRTLTITRTGSGSGTVISSPTGIDCGLTCSAAFTYASQVTLTATPGADSFIVGYTGACVAAPCRVTMSADKMVSVEFGLASTNIQPVSNVITGAGRVTSGTMTLDLQIGGGLSNEILSNGATVEMEAGSAAHPAQQR